MKIIAWELTRKCKLRCLHCRASALDNEYENELTTDESKKVIDSLSKNLPVLLIMTGGDPLLRTDIYDIAKYAVSKHLRVVMAVCGSSLNEENVNKIVDSGISAISLSLDSFESRMHDEFRCTQGSFDATINAAKIARKIGLPFQINTTITNKNCADLEKISELVFDLGATTHDIFILVPTGRGAQLKDLISNRHKYEDILHRIAKLNLIENKKIKVTCAPQYSRIWMETRKTMEECESTLVKQRPNGCMGGDGFTFISHTGYLQPCGFLDLSCGNLRDFNYDFWEPYRSSKIFNDIKNKNLYSGKCGICEYWNICKGCRARALALNNNYLSEEPLCEYSPIKSEYT